MVKIRENNINSGSFWDDLHAAAHPHNASIFAQFDRLFTLGLIPDFDCSILDVGCGQALHAPKLEQNYPKIEFTGLDLSPRVLEKNKQWSEKAKFICADIEKEDLQGTYDYIVSFHTFEHFTDPVSVLKKCLVAARKRVIICVPYEDAWNADPSHVHRFTLTEPFSGYIDYKIVNNDQEIFFVFEGLAK